MGWVAVEVGALGDHCRKGFIEGRMEEKKEHTEQVEIVDCDGNVLVELQVSMFETEGKARDEAGENDISCGDMCEEGRAEGTACGEERVEV